MKHTSHSDYSLSGLDLFLALLGLVGVALFFIFLPSEHPDSSVNLDVTEEQILTRTSDFLFEQGIQSEGLEAVAILKRRTNLLEALQRDLGREEALQFLSSNGRNELSGYYWDVDYFIPIEPKSRNFGAEPDILFQFELSQSGKIISFDDRNRIIGTAAAPFGNTRFNVNRKAIGAALKPDSLTDSEIRTQLSALPDSIITQFLHFDLPAVSANPLDLLIKTPETQLPVTLDSTQLKKLINFHLAATPFADAGLQIDSIRVASTTAPFAARVQLKTQQPIAGQHIALEMLIPPSGTLTFLDAEFTPVVKEEADIAAGLSIIGGGLFGLLALIFIIVFFKRMIARLLDMKSAMIDAMILGVAVGIMTVLITFQQAAFISSAKPWIAALISLLIFSFSAGGAAVLAFMVAGVTDSVVREHDESKLKTLILLRHGDLRNRPFGASLLRGLSFAGILLGISVIMLGVFPQIDIRLPDLTIADASARPVGTILFQSFATSYFWTLIWLVGVASAAFRWSTSPVLAIILIGVTGTVMNLAPYEVNAGYLGLIVSGAFALVLAWTYIKFDILTAIVAVFVMRVIWKLGESFLIPEISNTLDGVLGGLFLAVVLVLGILGVISKRTGTDAEMYVPGYVTEMAGQERVKRELEIAGQVQTFFLPRKMPKIEGLDIAGMCLPATEVGGDYYDFIELEGGKMAFILGDVSGKGIQAAFFMTLVKGIIQTLCRQKLGSAEVMRRLNHLFCMNAPPGTFISVIYGEYDPADQSFTFSRAGHNPAILFEESSAQACALQPKGMAIGFSDGERFDSTIEEKTVYLKPGDSMVFYTDGFSEAMNRKRDLYGDDRLLTKVTHFGNKSASSLLRLLTEDVHHFIEGMGRADDMTMVVFKKLPQS